MNYNINYGDKKSIRYYFIKDLHNQYYQPLQGYTQGYTQTQVYTGSGLNGEATREATAQYIFLPSDPDELVDQLKLLYFEKIGRK